MACVEAEFDPPVRYVAGLRDLFNKVIQPMTQKTLESLSSMVSVLDMSELDQAEKMISARRSYLVAQKILTIPVGAEVEFRRSGEDKLVGYCYSHHQRSIVVQVKNDVVRVDFNDVLKVNGQPWHD